MMLLNESVDAFHDEFRNVFVYTVNECYDTSFKPIYNETPQTVAHELSQIRKHATFLKGAVYQVL